MSSPNLIMNSVNTPTVKPLENPVVETIDILQVKEDEDAEVDKLTSLMETDQFENKRTTWTKGLDFILTCVGFAVGIGNIWRFPYLCYKNGGGAFLIPYFICIVTCGIPIFLLELGLGQYMTLGSIGAWRIVPAFQGIGVASFVITFLMNIYYIVVLAWAVFYLFNSFSKVLPWSHCQNEWNTGRCFAKTNNNVSSESGHNVSYFRSSNLTTEPHNYSLATNSTNYTSLTTLTGLSTVDPVVEFWENKVLQISDGVDSPGSMVYHLVISLFVVWVLVYFCVWRGVKWSGKVVYFTSLFPYVILTILLVRGVTLDGAIDGIVFYIKPDMQRLTDPQVWIDGATQIFFSYAIALGAMITLGSYNEFNNNFYKDCVLIATINSCTSLYGGFAVFSVLGFMAREQNVSVADVAESGPGLVFMAYPKAVTQMPIPQLWAVLFFLMVLLVGLGSQFVAVEGFLTPLFDMLPRRLRTMKVRMLVTGLYCAISFVLGLSMVTQGGMYIFQLFDYYCASGLVLLWVCFFEAFVIAWVFGSSRFVDAIELMIGRRISAWFVLCWRYITPTLTTGLFLFMIIDFTPLTYNKTYQYPRSVQGFGMCLALASMVCVPLVFILKMIRTPGSLRQRWVQLTTPVLKKHQIPPNWKVLGYK